MHFLHVIVRAMHAFGCAIERWRMRSNAQVHSHCGYSATAYFQALPNRFRLAPSNFCANHSGFAQ